MPTVDKMPVVRYLFQFTSDSPERQVQRVFASVRRYLQMNFTAKQLGQETDPVYELVKFGQNDHWSIIITCNNELSHVNVIQLRQACSGYVWGWMDGGGE